jgi:hypothetical protein
MKDSLWSIDLFRCESATLRTYWVLVVMDRYTRRIIGFGVQAGTVDGVALCRMSSAGWPNMTMYVGRTHQRGRFTSAGLNSATECRDENIPPRLRR